MGENRSKAKKNTQFQATAEVMDGNQEQVGNFLGASDGEDVVVEGMVGSVR
jgi:hypothetical protein